VQFPEQSSVGSVITVPSGGHQLAPVFDSAVPIHLRIIQFYSRLNSHPLSIFETFLALLKEMLVLLNWSEPIELEGGFKVRGPRVSSSTSQTIIQVGDRPFMRFWPSGRRGIATLVCALAKCAMTPNLGAADMRRMSMFLRITDISSTQTAAIK
jgi:hypothetical protein